MRYPIDCPVPLRYEEEGVHHFQLVDDYVNQCAPQADLMMAADGKCAHHHLDRFVSIKRLLFHRHEFGLILLTGEFFAADDFFWKKSLDLGRQVTPKLTRTPCRNCASRAD